MHIHGKDYEYLLLALIRCLLKLCNFCSVIFTTESDSSSASQTTPNILPNPEVHYDDHKVPAPTRTKLLYCTVLPRTIFQINLILPSHLRLGLSAGVIPSSLANKTRQALFPPHLAHALPVLYSSFWSPEYLVTNTNHKAPHCVIFSILLLFTSRC